MLMHMLFQLPECSYANGYAVCTGVHMYTFQYNVPSLQLVSLNQEPVRQAHVGVLGNLLQMMTMQGIDGCKAFQSKW